MISALLIVLGSGLCLANFVFPYMVTVQEAVQVPYQDVENRETLLERAENYMISEYSYSGYILESGKTIIVSWQADNNVIVYLMTQSQYNNFVSTRLAQNLKSQYGASGSFSYPIQFNGVYYVVIYNPYWFFTQVRIVFYESKVTWQETVTLYRTEYIPKEVKTDLYLYSGLVIIGIGVFAPMLERRKGEAKTITTKSPSYKAFRNRIRLSILKRGLAIPHKFF
ncbi:MAG: hypothetical protein QXL52_05505 [Nitrososphaerales archaeon]